MKNLYNVKHNFPKYFGTEFQPFYDGVLTFVFNTVQIDYPKFSDWLNSPDGMSDNEYIEQKFGKEAAEWFDETFIKTMQINNNEQRQQISK